VEHESGQNPKSHQEPELGPAQLVSAVTPARQLAPLPQVLPMRSLDGPRCCGSQEPPLLEVAKHVAPAMPVWQLAPLPMQFAPTSRQQAFVVTQPQPPSAPHKRMLEAVECRSKELCGSDLLSAEQARICPEVC